MLIITVQNAHQRSEHRFESGEVFLGRHSNASGPHIIIDDECVSRRQLRLQPASESAIQLENVGRARVVLPGGQVVRSGERREIPLPSRLRCGNTELHIAALVADGPHDDDVFDAAGPTYHSIPRPVAFSVERTPDSLERLGEAPSPERLAAWFETLLSVQRAAAGSTEFYEETAQALVNLVGLDRGLVLLREEGAWQTVAGHAKDDTIGLHFSRSVLAKVLEDKSTVFGNPDEIASGASLLRVEAVVASPILDDQQNVVGALYGSRDLVSSGMRAPFRPLDAQMVQILAGAVGAGLVRQRIQEKLKAAEQLAAVGQAIGYIIHDLRGPLGNAGQLVGMLRAGDTKTLTREEQLSYIGDSVSISQELLNDSLEFCRGQVHVSPIRGQVLELLHKHLELLRLDLAAIPVRLRLEIPSGLEGTLDPPRIARVLRNLAKNAGEALAGRAGATVEIGAHAVPNGIELWVADNGPGLPEAVREKLFQPFATQGKRGGTGFGLAISKQLVEAHRGIISVTTGAGGTRFSILLPLEIALAAAPSDKGATRLSNSGIMDTDSTTRLSASDTAARHRKRLLLAEDGAVNQKLIAGLLKNAGHEVTIASDGREALAAWEQGSFDLVLMDLEMPVMSGLEVTAAMRAKEARGRKRTPVVALTAHESPETKEACRRVAMDGYLEKPVRPQALLSLIDELCPVAGAR